MPTFLVPSPDTGRGRVQDGTAESAQLAAEAVQGDMRVSNDRQAEVHGDPASRATTVTRNAVGESTGVYHSPAMSMTSIQSGQVVQEDIEVPIVVEATTGGWTGPHMSHLVAHVGTGFTDEWASSIGLTPSEYADSLGSISPAASPATRSINGDNAPSYSVANTMLGRAKRNSTKGSKLVELLRKTMTDPVRSSSALQERVCKRQSTV